MENTEISALRRDANSRATEIVEAWEMAERNELRLDGPLDKLSRLGLMKDIADIIVQAVMVARKEFSATAASYEQRISDQAAEINKLKADIERNRKKGK